MKISSEIFTLSQFSLKLLSKKLSKKEKRKVEDLFMVIILEHNFILSSILSIKLKNSWCEIMVIYDIF